MVVKKRKIVRSIVLVVIGAIVAMILFSSGYIVGAKQLFVPQSFELINQRLGQPEKLDFSVFWQVWEEVHQKYPDFDQIDDQKLVRGAISGMVAALGDPFSAFLPPDQAERFSQDLEGSFGGVGIEIEMIGEQLTITAPLDDTPGQRAGLKSGDIILEIDSQSTEEMGFEEMVTAIRGKVGTEVKLTIYREGWAQEQEFQITREKITVESVKYSLTEVDQFGYLKINQFGSDTENLLESMVAEIEETSPPGLILDLRNNPGGYLDVAVKVASYFIEDGVIVRQVSRDEEKELKAVGRATLQSYPVVVLINEGSASGSEIVAGALRDHNQAILIGTKTFGKGSVQDIEQIKKWGSLKLTVARWQTPNGELINGKGIEADIEVEMDSSKLNTEKDIQLQRAIKELKRKMD